MTISPQMFGVVIGGIIPAILYAATGIFSKTSTQEGIGLGPYLVIIGLTITLTGCGFFLFDFDRTVNWKSGLGAFGLGLTWGVGTGLVAIGLTRFQAPLSQLVPIYNMNSLIAVLLALWIFAEWKQVKPLQLIIGSLLIVLGGTLVARA